MKPTTALIPSAVSSGEWSSLLVPICRTMTLGDMASESSPSCNRQSRDSVLSQSDQIEGIQHHIWSYLYRIRSSYLSPAMPKFKLCIWQKDFSQMLELDKFMIWSSPSQRMSGSASLASDTKRRCCRNK